MKAKKEIKKVKTPEPIVEVKQDIIAKKQVAKLDLNFGREDLNQLANKINEIIDAI